MSCLPSPYGLAQIVPQIRKDDACVSAPCVYSAALGQKCIRRQFFKPHRLPFIRRINDELSWTLHGDNCTHRMLLCDCTLSMPQKLGLTCLCSNLRKITVAEEAHLLLKLMQGLLAQHGQLLLLLAQQVCSQTATRTGRHFQRHGPKY